MKRYSIITDDLNHCIVCGKTKEALHEVFFGTANRKKSIEHGLVIPLCNMHHNMSDAGIHYNKEFDNQVKIIGQKAFMKYYHKSVEEFRQIFGKNYLD